MAKIDLDEKIAKIADKVNKKRRQELISIYNNTDLFRTLKRIKDNKIFNKGNKSKTMRAIASYPVEVDMFFQKLYGDEYYKDPDFFTKHYPEWLVIDRRQL